MEEHSVLETAAMVAAAPAPALRASGFGKRYGHTIAVESLDLQIARGEIFGLLGPDGAGKSSLMKAAAGVLSYESGRLEVLGVPLQSERDGERIKGRLGFMPQGLGQNLYPELSIEENIDFFARLRLVPEAELAERKRELLAATRLESFRERPMKQLSGGMKQKLGLVCTLIHAPELIILDEPTTGVDPVSRRDFWSILGGLLQERGITALISTAYMDEASRFQRVALMFGGKLLAADTPAAMARRVHGSTVTISVRGLAASRVEEDLQRLRKSYEQTDLSGTTLRVFADGCTPEEAQDRIGALLPEMAKEMLSSDVPTLEDTFIALVREQGLQQLARETASTMAFGGQPVATSSPGAAIEARELTRDFGAFRAVDRVSFSVPPGQIFGLLGANGAGKSTVIKMLTGILRPTGGRGRVAGADMQSAGWGIKERIGYMSQAFSLYLDLTVAENLRLYAGIYGLSPELMQERLEWALDMAGLRALRDRRAAALPMGQRQRLALDCALMHRPRVLFLDEPTSGVDPIGRRTFWELLYRLSREEHVAILVTTHYMSEAENCDHLALLYAGRIVADDTPEGMKAAVEREAGRLLEVSGVDAQAAIQSLAPQYPHATLFGDRIHLFSRDGERDAEQIAALLAHANLGAARVTFQRLTMEDVFVYRVTELEAAARKAA